MGDGSRSVGSSLFSHQGGGVGGAFLRQGEMGHGSLKSHLRKRLLENNYFPLGGFGLEVGSLPFM